ncbi:MAG: hypothetical protein P1U85_00425 [Verrucomicrobiales bacterium]|jgi:hypothetical protein|nr:hypothetical protein [Verrucomicrobiales bacterium]
MHRFLLGILSIPFLVSLGSAAEPSSENPDRPSRYPFEQRLIFFSVLEGLYETGVTGEALELLIPNPEGMWVEGKPERTNFVYACPICTPAFDALRLYHSRKTFYGQKATHYNTFGPGLDDETLSKLQDTPEIRRKAIRSLIESWISLRLERMDLTEEKRSEISENLTEMKNKGEELLQTFQEREPGDIFTEHYKDWKSCPFCDGAAAAGNHPF